MSEEDDARAFRYGVQVANEAIFRTLLLALLDPIENSEGRHRTAMQIRGLVERAIALRLQAGGTADEIEERSAASIVASVFDDLLAADALPSSSSS